MTINEILLWGKQTLETAHNPRPWLDAELLLAHVLNQPRTFVIAHTDEQLNKATDEQYHHVVARRCRGEPLAYITGKKEFCGLSFCVTPDVLIPRPATEELVEKVLSHCTSERPFAPTIIDIGTGSGCIAVTIAKRIPSAHIIATDISDKALAVARENAARHKVIDRITFLQGDLLTPILQTDNLPLPTANWILVANLPYVPTSRLESKPDLQFEPREALDGGPDGAFLYRRFMNQLSMIHDQWLPSLIALEIEDETYHALLASPEWASIQLNRATRRNVMAPPCTCDSILETKNRAHAVQSQLSTNN